jgi:hypothetical protein
MSEQEVTSASPISGTAVMNSESANAVETPKAPQRPTKQQLIAQRKLRKAIQEHQRKMKKPVTTGTHNAWLRTIDEQMKKFDSFLKMHHDLIRFLKTKGVFDEDEFVKWQVADAAEQAAKKAEEATSGNSDGEVQPDLQPAQAEAE